MTNLSINPWSLLQGSLWLFGLALILSAAGVASYQAYAKRTRPRRAIVRPGFQVPLFLGLALVCLGLLLGESPWWVRLALALLTVFFFGQAAWLWWRGRAAKSEPTDRPLPAPAERSPVAVRAGRLGWALLLVGLLVIAAWVAVTGLRVVRHARSLEAHLDAVEGLVAGGAAGLDSGAFEAAGQHLSAMSHDLEVIQGMVGPLLPLGRVLRHLPRYGGDLVAASDLLEVAVGVTTAGDRVFQSLSPILAPGDSPTLSLSERFLPVAVAAQPELRTAREELTAVEEARARIDARTLSPQVARLLQRLDSYLPLLGVTVDGLLLAPQLLGADGTKTYLILAQNNHELRPSGGFISGVGELTVEGGRVSSLTFSDSYAVDNWQVPHDLTPPDLQATLGGQLWVFRDANWHADFPTSARRALEIYARERGVEAGGVIALDLTGLVSLLDALGPLSVAGIDGPVTGRNVVEVIQEGWHRPPDSTAGQSADWWQHRKDSFGAIATAATDRLLTGASATDPSLDLVRLARAIQRVLQEKHLLLYLDDPRAAELLGANDWDGALPDPSDPCDFLLVVDTNVGFNKVDPNVERAIDYQVDLGAGSRPLARLTLTYRNHSQSSVPYCVQEARYGESYADMMDRCYWDYVRIYVPPGSKLLMGPDLALPPGSLLAQQGNAPAALNLSDQVIEDDWTAWTAFFDLAPGEERTLAFEYQLPASVLDRAGEQINYCLRAGKQPGTEAVPFCFQALPPANAGLVAWASADLPLSERACTDLRIDRDFWLHYGIGKGSP